MAFTDAELAAKLADLESDLVERKETFGGDAPNAVRQAICAFANDLADHRQPGVVFVGVADDGKASGLEVNDALLLNLAHCKTDGNIVPPPTMSVTRHRLAGGDVAVVTVTPSDSPPVRYRGRIWVRVRPRRALASAQDERILTEKRRHGDAPFDARPVRGATLDDLDLARFRYLYLPRAFDEEILARNDRTEEERLAATKMIVGVDQPVPTVLGVLMLAEKPMDFIPGAYVQFIRFAGTDRADPIIDNARFDGPMQDNMRDLDSTLRGQVRTSVEIGSETTEVRRSTYALDALREFMRNAVMHRAYEATNSPVHLSWFDDRVEIVSPGGPFGDVEVGSFGEPGVIGYRNPNLAEAMRVCGLIQRFGVGIPMARRALRDNNQPPPEFEVDSRRVRCTVRVRPDWPGNL